VNRCHGKAINITYLCVCVCVHVGLFIQHATRYVPYCDVICGVCIHHIFRHCQKKGTIFGRKLLSIKCVFFIFSTTFFFSNILHPKKNLAKCCHKRENIII
jgi:hypothetical protein